MFALSDENGVHIMRQCYPVCLLRLIYEQWQVLPIH